MSETRAHAVSAVSCLLAAAVFLAIHNWWAAVYALFAVSGHLAAWSARREIDGRSATSIVGVDQ